MQKVEYRPTQISINGGDKTIYRVNPVNDPEINGHPLLATKLIPLEDLEEAGKFIRSRKQEIALTTGVFDMVHIGHMRYLELARSLVDDIGVLVVGLNSDSSVHELKGPTRPILSETERAEALAFLNMVTFISIFPQRTGAEIIRLLKPDKYLCVEGSWKGDIATKDEVKAMFEVGGRVYFAPPQGPKISTSEIIGRIEKSSGLQVGDELKQLMQSK